jgi:uncharacterized protein (TIGR00661 family)
LAAIDPDVVFNFYDMVGALALNKMDPGIIRIGIGHHFFLHLDGYRCKGGKILHRELLKWHTRLVMSGCDHVLALSYRKIPGNQRIRVVPPLVRKAFRHTLYQQGNRYLVYFLSEGFLSELNHMVKNDPEFQADLFSGLPVNTEVSGRVRLYGIQDRAFLERMTSCRGLITTAGFDSIAEAAYMGIPVAVIPAHNHYEQRCNSVDIARSGLGIILEEFSKESLQGMKRTDNTEFCSWVDQAGERILSYMEK